MLFSYFLLRSYLLGAKLQLGDHEVTSEQQAPGACVKKYRQCAGTSGHTFKISF